MLKSAAELLEEALEHYKAGNKEGLCQSLIDYDQRIKSGAFAPMVEVRGDVLKELLADLVFTKDELRQKTAVCGG